jgi:hypothetical protein
MTEATNIIDAAVRFLRSNPALLACAQAEAGRGGITVDGLLRDTVARARGEVGASTIEAIAQEQMARRATHRQQRGSG